jgi:hypothetical protein
MACKMFQEMVTLDRMGRSKEMGLVLVRPVQTTSRTVSTSGRRRNLDCRGGSGFCSKENHNRLLVERPKFEKSTFQIVFLGWILNPVEAKQKLY